MNSSSGIKIDTVGLLHRQNLKADGSKDFHVWVETCSLWETERLDISDPVFRLFLTWMQQQGTITHAKNLQNMKLTTTTRLLLLKNR